MAIMIWWISLWNLKYGKIVVCEKTGQENHGRPWMDYEAFHGLCVCGGKITVIPLCLDILLFWLTAFSPPLVSKS